MSQSLAVDYGKPLPANNAQSLAVDYGKCLAANNALSLDQGISRIPSRPPS